MSGQSANYSVREVKSTINKLESNKQTSGTGSNSGAETDAQLGHKNTMQKKSC